MRIIGGTHGGRRIAAPPGRATRPMLERVREAVFSTLAPWLEGALVLDLFAGSGSLGLEALSRGARSARFVERDARTLALLAENARALGLEERAAAVRGDALAPESWGEEPLDVVFLDPPYALAIDPAGRRAVLRALEALVEGRMAADGVAVLHVPRGHLDAHAFAPSLVVRRRDYGTNAIWYVGSSRAEEPA